MTPPTHPAGRTLPEGGVSATAGRVRIGISGWRYAGWRGDFYPTGLVQRRELAYAAERLTSIEVNGSFYSLQRPASWERWRDDVPEDFVFSVKGPRFITHLRRLRECEQALANFFASGVLLLGRRLGPVLWQLPERLTFEREVVDAFLATLPRRTTQAAALARRYDGKVKDPSTVCLEDAPLRHALEFRSPTFAGDEALALLRHHDVACVLADTAGRWPRVDRLTTDFAYVRLHGDSELYASGYDDSSLDGWAERFRRWSADGIDVWCYFDNDAKGHAPYDAMRLIERLAG